MREAGIRGPDNEQRIKQGADALEKYAEALLEDGADAVFEAFARDRLHPNQIGAEIMAPNWFETLLGHDGLEVPEWSRKELPEAN